MRIHKTIFKILMMKTKGPKYLLAGIILFFVNLIMEIFFYKSLSLIWLIGALLIVAGVHHYNKELKDLKTDKICI